MNITNPFSTPSTPGVAGPAGPGQPVVYDPATGLYVNQSTGGVSTDPGGQHPVQNPSLATQAARNISISNNLMANMAQYGQQYGQSFGNQTALVEQLKRIAAGEGGPSVAESQLEQGLGQIRSAENSEAAGATGANAALARTTAMNATGDAMTSENQAAGVLRAREIADARAQEEGVLGQQANEASGMYGTDLSGALTASGQAEQAEGTKEAADQQAQEQQNQLEFNLLNGAGQAAAKGATSGMGGGGGAAATSDEREKKDVKKLSDGDMEQLLSKIAGYGFDYKHPGTDGEAPGHRVGVMAQDVKAGGPAGKAMVIGGNPMKLDLPNAVGAALAAVAYLKKRIDQDHGRKAA